MVFAKLDDPWATTLVYDGKVKWPTYSEGAPLMLDIPTQTKPISHSKIVWTAGLSVLAYVFLWFWDLPPGDKATLASAYGILQGFAVAALRIWFTSTSLK